MVSKERAGKEYDSYYEFKDCKTSEEYREKYLGCSPFEDAYQLAYDMSNDWFLNAPTWQDVQDAFILGTKMKYSDVRCDYDIIMWNRETQEPESHKYTDKSFDEIYEIISNIDKEKYATYQLYRISKNNDK